MHSATAIEVHHLSKSFILHHNRASSLKARVIGLFKKRWQQRTEEFFALRDVSFTVQRGESIALLGHNGSGKSTLLQLIASIIKPTSGKVVTYGRITPFIELGVGFNVELTGEENIYLNASMYGLKNREIAKLFNDIVAFSGLGRFIDVPVKNYSSGMYARLGFSIAVHLQPDILLIDEILAVGDEDFQKACHEKIRALQARGTTLVLVTHSQEQAKHFCKRFIKLNAGVLEEEGFF